MSPAPAYCCCILLLWSMPEASSSQPQLNLDFQPLGCARLALKQSLHKTGLPVDGLNGTESFLPHWSHVISNLWRSPPCPFEPPKFARRASRHGLHRFG